jgi:uncharacterized protein YkwD
VRWFLALVCAGCAAGDDDGYVAADRFDSGDPDLTPGYPAAWAALEDEVLRLVNGQRFLGATCGDHPIGGGVGPLESDGILRGVARAHSEDMSNRDFFEHTNPDGDDPGDRMSAAGFTGAQPWGENIAMGPRTAQAVVDLWMGSPPHCENILYNPYAVIGIGYFEGPAGPYWTQNFAVSH